MILGAFISSLYHVVLLTPWRADWHLSTPQVLYRADLEPEPQIGGARELEEKDSAHRCCCEYPPHGIVCCCLL